MREYKYFVIHCMASPPHVNFTKQGIVNIFKQKGWRQVGYRQVINADGTFYEFTEDNGDKFIQSNEITNGVRGFNTISQHISYAGGVDENGKPKDTRTLSQYLTMIDLVLEEIERHPNILIVGHNQFKNVNKACPSFDVPKFLDEISNKTMLSKKMKSLGAGQTEIDLYLTLKNIEINEKNICRTTINY